jgi:hypothetical protein
VVFLRAGTLQLEVLISVKVILTEELEFRLAKLFEDVKIMYVNGS